MERPDGPLVCAEQPTFEERGHAVDTRHHLMSGPSPLAEVRRPMPIAPHTQCRVSLPAIGVNEGTWLDVRLHEGQQAGARDVGDGGEPDASYAFVSSSAATATMAFV